MTRSKNKLIRYSNIFKRVINWNSYLFIKFFGTNKKINFQIRNFGSIEVDREMMGPFRENFFDDIYFRYIPKNVFEGQTDPVVIDIGANVGFFSLATFMKFPKAVVYSFEPHPYCFQVMTNYKQAFKHFNWNLFQRAVSDQDADIKLNTNTVSGFATMTTVFDDKKRQEEFLAKTVKLNLLLSDNNIENVDFIKVDCEGAEYSILYDLPKDSFDKINSMCVETHKGEDSNQNIDFLNDYLKQLGFTTKMLKEAGSTGYIWAWKSSQNKTGI